MKKLLMPILILAAAGGGLGAGMVLKPEKPDPCADEMAASEDGAAGSAMSDECNSAAQEPEETYDPGEPTEFAELDKQFVIPVLNDGLVVAMVVTSLAIEVEVGATQETFSKEPKLRDAFLQVLFVHAHSGGFGGDFTASRAMKDLKGKLKEAAKPILGEILRDVLITEIVRQEL